MTDTHTERAFEAYVEATLLERGGWQRGTTAEWDVERMLFPAQVCAFLEATRQELWAEMRALHAAGLDALVIEALGKELAVKGTLHVLRHGFKCYGKTFRPAAFKPAHALNDAALTCYARNVLTVTRQVPCHPGRRDTVDLLLALNGLTAEPEEVAATVVKAIYRRRDVVYSLPVSGDSSCWFLAPSRNAFSTGSTCDAPPLVLVLSAAQTSLIVVAIPAPRVSHKLTSCALGGGRPVRGAVSGAVPDPGTIPNNAPCSEF